jgi:hypothetical protein
MRTDVRGRCAWAGDGCRIRALTNRAPRRHILLMGLMGFVAVAAARRNNHLDGDAASVALRRRGRRGVRRRRSGFRAAARLPRPGPRGEHSGAGPRPGPAPGTGRSVPALAGPLPAPPAQLRRRGLARPGRGRERSRMRGAPVRVGGLHHRIPAPARRRPASADDGTHRTGRDRPGALRPGPGASGVRSCPPASTASRS